MRPRNRLSLMMLALAVAACSQGRADPTEQAQEAGSAWRSPPHVEAVRASGADISVSGQAAPGARVALRGAEGVVFAASADDSGRFDIRMPAPANPVLLTPEVQTGQEASPAPEQLLILAGGRGPIAALTPGGPSRRLDARQPLGAVDWDGRMLALSGSVETGVPVRLVIDGRPAIEATGDKAGRWAAVAGGRPGPADISVNGRRYAYPGADPAGAAPTRAGEGWLIRQPLGEAGFQTTWLPDAAPTSR